ncbi:glycoside hydrolase family 3 C-terminal domain-containing protein [Kineosporia babensis]|uniref:Exo-alpha-(1->6)-L-arabinopyranosidase n=1 Tax=Kineosporia babensis TaxID=499548 RepID=A0A9X1N905_9ACTN|nr:glycoside hydrolase family 3 C-terminal domain-containing protein [Kineosporia babensis]MCD5310727.1 glycoside hydrolase family 3 C-terminal domain-containing protein [Kineosporia babensis]
MHHLVAQLTIEEKVTLLSGASLWNTPAVERLGIPASLLTDGPHGVRLQLDFGDHLGFNQSEPATAFPTAAATGSTWNPSLLQEMGEALGRESRSFGVDVLLGPGVNIKRSPLCGRNFEYFSEDPLLAGALGAAWVQGLQSQGVGASVKHFAANNQETERMRVSAEVDERTLREIYLPAFEHIVKTAQPATIMASYNRLNGVYVTENHWLLEEVLRDDWGFEGYVVSDWGAVSNPPKAVAGGTDLAMPAADGHADEVLAAVKNGELDESVVDRAVSRLLTVLDRLRAAQQAQESFDRAKHHELARRIAAESTVLLVNRKQVLPLDVQDGGTLAVIGEFARSPRFQGAGSSHIVPTQVDNALDAVKAATSREVVFSAGFLLDGTEDDALLAEAVETARNAANVVLFLGLPDRDESEGFDRTHIDLPAVQLALLQALTAVRDDVVIVLSNGSVVDLSPAIGKVGAILETWLGGQAGGSATADVLFGTAEPGGRLAETIPLSLADNPAHVNWPGTPQKVHYGERIYVGYRWYDATERNVAFPFGFGLSYTTFEISDVVVAVADPAAAKAVVSAVVTNTGDRDGSEVVQIYVGDPKASVDRPVRELKAFAKVHLAPGEKRTLTFELGERDFAFWSPKGWLVEPGEFTIDVATSSRDFAAHEVITLEVPSVVPDLDADSTLGDWLEHPTGAAVLHEHMANQDAPTTAAMFADEHMRTMVASMPLRALLSFGSSVDSKAVVADLLAQV